MHQADSAILTVACDVGQAVLGGGGLRGSNQAMQASYPAILAVTGATLGTPAINGQSPNGWTVIFNNANPNNRVFVVCGP